MGKLISRFFMNFKSNCAMAVGQLEFNCFLLKRSLNWLFYWHPPRQIFKFWKKYIFSYLSPILCLDKTDVMQSSSISPGCLGALKPPEPPGSKVQKCVRYRSLF